MWKKYYEIQLTKDKMDPNNRKMANHPPSPDFYKQCKAYVQKINYYGIIIISVL